jgi:hypothetical protein
MATPSAAVETPEPMAAAQVTEAPVRHQRSDTATSVNFKTAL